MLKHAHGSLCEKSAKIRLQDIVLNYLFVHILNYYMLLVIIFWILIKDKIDSTTLYIVTVYTYIWLTWWSTWPGATLYEDAIQNGQYVALFNTNHY